MRKFNEVNYIRPEFTSVSKETGDYINYTLEYGLFDISDRQISTKIIFPAVCFLL